MFLVFRSAIRASLHVQAVCHGLLGKAKPGAERFEFFTEHGRDDDGKQQATWG
jgi:hypothetical protein